MCKWSDRERDHIRWNDRSIWYKELLKLCMELVCFLRRWWMRNTVFFVIIVYGGLCFLCRWWTKKYFFFLLCMEPYVHGWFKVSLCPRLSIVIVRRYIIDIVRKSCRKHFWIVSLMICFPLRLDKVMIVLHCWGFRRWFYFSIVNRQFKCCAQAIDRRHSEANLSVK
jgi:hypothetical protein